MKVAIYARVSTDDKEQDPERQLLKCRQYCELHQHTIIGEWQEHHTGDSDPFRRPEAGKALRSGAEAIIIYSMDRLTRQHPVKVIRLIQDLKEWGVKVVSVTEPAFNMEHDMSEVMLYLIGWFNNYFLKKLKRDIKSGMEKAKAQGKHIGRPRKHFNRYRAAQLLKEGVSVRDVAGIVGVSPATISRFKRVSCENL